MRFLIICGGECPRQNPANNAASVVPHHMIIRTTSSVVFRWGETDASVCGAGRWSTTTASPAHKCCYSVQTLRLASAKFR